MRCLLLAAVLIGCGAPARAENKKNESPITLTLVVKKNKYKFDPELLERVKKSDRAHPPEPIAVDLVLVFTNVSKQDATIRVGGDDVVYTFELTGGAGTETRPSGLVFTQEFRASKMITLAPGKTHEIPVKQLTDGFRGAGRNVYWTGPGEYKLSATYGPPAVPGGAAVAPLYKSEPVKITVEK
jgi:hypothetical protein